MAAPKTKVPAPSLIRPAEPVKPRALVKVKTLLLLDTLIVEVVAKVITLLVLIVAPVYCKVPPFSVIGELMVAMLKVPAVTVVAPV